MLYRFARFVLAIVFRIIFNFEIVNKPEKIEGSGIIVANHISMWDPIAMAISTERSLHFMGKKEFFKYDFFNFFIYKLNAFPVDRKKGADMNAIRTALSKLKDGEVLGIFPEGTRVDSIDISNMKEGVGYLAIKGKCPIYVYQIEADYRFRGKVKFIYKGIIDYKDYSGKTTEKSEKMTVDIFNLIYK